MSSIKIHRLRNKDTNYIQLWDEYVKAQALPAQACYAWRNILEDVFSASVHALLALHADGRVLGFALVYYTPGHEVLYSTRYGFHAVNQDVAVLLEDSISAFAENNDLTQSVITSGAQSFDLSGQQATKTSLYLPLDFGDEDSLWLSVPKKTKNMIRKAGKSNIEISYDWEYLDQFYDVYMNRFLGKSLSIKPIALFHSIRDLFGDNAVFICALHDGKLVAGMVFISAEFGVSYAYNASIVNASNNGANNLLMWEAMKLFRDKGAAYIDLSESSPESPVYKFKMRLSKNIDTKTIHYFDFVGGMHASKTTPFPLLVRHKINGLLFRLMPLMPRFVKIKYLKYIGGRGRVI